MQRSRFEKSIMQACKTAEIILISVLSACGGSSGDVEVGVVPRENNSLIYSHDVMSKYSGKYTNIPCEEIPYAMTTTPYHSMLSETVLSGTKVLNKLNSVSTTTYYSDNYCSIPIGSVTLYDEVVYVGRAANATFSDFNKPVNAEKIIFNTIHEVSEGIFWTVVQSHLADKAIITKVGELVYVGDHFSVKDADGFPTQFLDEYSVQRPL